MPSSDSRSWISRPFRRRTNAGADPEAFQVDPQAPQGKVEFIGYGLDQFDRRIITNIEELPALVAQFPRCWIDVDGLGDGQVLRRIGELFKLHPLALEDVVHVHQRAKVEEFDDHLFVVVRMLSMANDTLLIEQLSIFQGENFLLTFQEQPGDCLDPIRARLANPRSKLRTGSIDMLLHGVMDTVVDAYFPVIEEMGIWLDELDDRLANPRDQAAIREVHELRGDLLVVRRCLWPLREALHLLQRDTSPRISSETRLYLRDAYDHTVQALDVTEAYRELCSDLRDYHYAVVTTRTNDVMKFLTMIATIFMPMSFIAGVYGMNFNTQRSGWNMPELNWPWGYLWALCLMGTTATTLLWYFRRRGWLGATHEETSAR